MKKQTLQTALDAVQTAHTEIGLAHHHAVKSGDEFAVLYLLECLSDSAKLCAKIRAAVEAAK